MMGVVIVSFCSGNVIESCLNSLVASDVSGLRVVVCDNASPDDSVAIIRRWAEGSRRNFVELTPDVEDLTAGTLNDLTLIQLDRNTGFAGGVNAGLRYLMKFAEVEIFWILNPDCRVAPGTARAYMRRAAEDSPFALMGGRTLYQDSPQLIQSDGGRIRHWSGICYLVNQGKSPNGTSMPEACSLDFISGANMVASRAHLEQTGLLREDYFLFYEEVDWAARRGELPLILCPEAIVYHHGGTAIGSGSTKRRASQFANYFNYRNRLRFLRRFRPAVLPLAWSLSMMRIAKLFALGAFSEANGAFRGLNGLSPPKAVRAKISPAAQEAAFGKK